MTPSRFIPIWYHLLVLILFKDYSAHDSRTDPCSVTESVKRRYADCPETLFICTSLQLKRRIMARNSTTHNHNLVLRVMCYQVRKSHEHTQRISRVRRRSLPHHKFCLQISTSFIHISLIQTSTGENSVVRTGLSVLVVKHRSFVAHQNEFTFAQVNSVLHNQHRGPDRSQFWPENQWSRFDEFGAIYSSD